MRNVLLILSLVLAPFAAQAADVVGSAVIDGRVVELLSDRTWRYRDAGAASDAACEEISAAIVFCPGTSGWETTVMLNPDMSASFRLDDRTYLGFIPEDIGTAQGVTLDFMTNATIENAAYFSEMSETDVPVFLVEDLEVLGVPARTQSYLVSVDGLDVVYENTTVVFEESSLQIITMAIGTELTDRQEQLHAEVLANTRMRDAK